jgi:hypothetical protein
LVLSSAPAASPARSSTILTKHSPMPEPISRLCPGRKLEAKGSFETSFTP